MTDISFWSIYCPVLAALISSVILFEVFQLGLNRWLIKRQEKKTQRIREKIDAGEEISVEELGQVFPGAMLGSPREVPTDVPLAASGIAPPPAAGQYL